MSKPSDIEMVREALLALNRVARLLVAIGEADPTLKVPAEVHDGTDALAALARLAQRLQDAETTIEGLRGTVPWEGLIDERDDLRQRLQDAEAVIAAADHSAIPARDFLVREWRDKAEEYRVERDAAEVRATRAQEALRAIERQAANEGMDRIVKVVRATLALIPTPEPRQRERMSPEEHVKAATIDAMQNEYEYEQVIGWVDDAWQDDFSLTPACETENECSYTFAHTRHWCGHAGCRDS